MLKEPSRRPSMQEGEARDNEQYTLYAIDARGGGRSSVIICRMASRRAVAMA